MASKAASTGIKPVKDTPEKSFVIKSFIGGISDYDDKGVAGSFKGGSANLSIRRLTDSLYCQQGLVDEDNGTVITDLIVFIVNSSDGNTYGFSNTGRIYKRSTSKTWVLAYTDPDGAIQGATEWYDGGRATAVITSNNTNVSNNDTLVVGGITYKFVTSLTGAANEVLIGANADASLANLVLAINGGLGSGTNYGTGTLANTQVLADAEDSTHHTVTIEAQLVGTSGNSLTISTTAATLSLSGSTLSNGSTGRTYLYWACAGNKVHRKLIPGVTTLTWTDVDATGNGGDPWPKTGLTTAPWHTMKQAAGDLIICNDHYLAFVGYDNSFTTQAVDLIQGNQAKTVMEQGDYVIAGTGKKTGQQSADIFSWQTTALDWINHNSIMDAGVNAMISTEVDLCQVGTNGGVYYADFVDKLPAYVFPGGGQVNPDGVDNLNGMALFGAWGNGSGNSGVYTIGRIKKNAPFVMNLDYALNCDQIGSVKVAGSDILFSYKNGSSYGVKRVDTTTKATATYISVDLKAPTKPPSIPTIWTKIKLKTAQLPSGCSITCYYMLDKVGSWTQAYMAGNVTTYNVTNATEAVFLVQAVGEIFALQLVLTPSGNLSPEVHKIEIFFI